MPLNSMPPPASGSTLLVARRVGVLAAPLAPVRVTSSPSRTSSETPRKAGVLPYRTVIASPCSTALPQIGADDLGVVLHLCRCPGSDPPALVEHDDVVRD